MDSYLQINPPYRLLMGPGPININPRILQAMSNQIIGQYDCFMTDYMNQTMNLYRKIFLTNNYCTLIINGTSRAGIESILISTIYPGDKVLIPIFGRFGYLLCEIAKRCRAEVHTIKVQWGEIFFPDQIEDAIKIVKPKLLLIVHGDTSTTMLQPLSEIGFICNQYNVLLYVDATGSIGGNILETDNWNIDAVSAGMQKCLGGSPGSAPITLNSKIYNLIRERTCVEQGIRNSSHKDGNNEIIYSNYFDLSMIIDYWGKDRLNHHTESTSALFGVLECAHLILQEGLEKTIKRHQLHGTAMLHGIKGMGLKIFGNIKYKMNNILGVIIPKNIYGEQVRELMMEDFGIEIGTSFGCLHNKIWRISTMGYNARKDCVMRTLAALESVLAHLGFYAKCGSASQAAWDYYAKFKK